MSAPLSVLLGTREHLRDQDRLFRNALPNIRCTELVRDSELYRSVPFRFID
jgi:hypothetical protein